MVGVKLKEKRLYRHGGGIREEQPRVTVGRNQGKRLKMAWRGKEISSSFQGTRSQWEWALRLLGIFRYARPRVSAFPQSGHLGARGCCGHLAAWVPHLSFESSSHHLFLGL